jgi:hypothetical protein
MSLLSNRPLDWTNQTLNDLRDQLVLLYNDPISAAHVVDQAGIAQGYFPYGPGNMRQKWKEILDILAKQGKLRRLVELVSLEPVAEPYYAFFSKVLQQDDEERAREAAAGDRTTQDRPQERSGEAGFADRLHTFNEGNWKTLLRSIKNQDCTPFLGPGIYSGDVPSKAKIAKAWSEEHAYPLSNLPDITHVAQYLSMQQDPMFPRIEIAEKLGYKKLKDLGDMRKIFEVFAELPLPVYLTTNYDNFLFQALEEHPYKKPVQEFCRWDDSLRDIPSIYKKDSEFTPTHLNPLVFNFFGCIEHEKEEISQSLVVTEDEYFRYLVNISRNPELIPARVQHAISKSSLLFLGYSLSDFEFRVLLHVMDEYLKDPLSKLNVCIQLEPGKDIFSDPTKVQQYLDQYLFSRNNKLRVYWGTDQQFIDELEMRWKKYRSD